MLSILAVTGSIIYFSGSTRERIVHYLVCIPKQNVLCGRAMNLGVVTIAQVTCSELAFTSQIN